LLVTVNDAYGHSVADATRASLLARGLPLPGEATYDPYLPDWTTVVSAVRDSHPDLLVLSSHIPDGIAFRRAFLAAGLHVDAFIGSTMAQCLPDFGAALGPDAVGVFASDRPGGGFNPSALSPQAKALYDRLASVWRQRTGQAAPSEGGLAGFSAGWALFHIVLPRAAAAHDLSAGALAAAARSVDLPDGSLANGAGIRFATSPDRMGQNLRAAAVIWQWQAVRHSVVVWPPAYATGTVRFVPLPR
jgi:ABC-type branched-subunit amino acid transport system substrate-binding protein